MVSVMMAFLTALRKDEHVRKPAKALALAAMLSAGTVLVHPAPALAAAYTPEAACAKESGRGGWTHVRDNKRAMKDGKTVYGYVYLMWNRSLQKNCVAAIKTIFAGTPTYTQAIDRRGRHAGGHLIPLPHCQRRRRKARHRKAIREDVPRVTRQPRHGPPHS